MALPVITNVTVIYPNGQTSLAPGQQARVVVDAIDTDNFIITGNVTVTDGSGNAASSAFSVVVADGLTYAATASAGSIAQDPARPNEFILTAPAA